MKSFILSVVLSVIVIAAVIVNSFAANRVYSTLLDKLNSLPPAATDLSGKEIQEINDYLDEKKYYLYLILPQCSINELLCSYQETAEYCLASDTSSYKASLGKTKLLVKAMKDNEGLRLHHFLFHRHDSKKRYFP